MQRKNASEVTIQNFQLGLVDLDEALCSSEIWGMWSPGLKHTVHE